VIPLGADKPSIVDLRVIAASNADLEQAIAEGRFRHDLYYRLNVVQIKLPPLRQRARDVLVLADYFLSIHAPSTKLAGEVKEAFHSHPWPGNIRELKNIILTALTRIEGSEIRLEHLPYKLGEHQAQDHSIASIRTRPRHPLKAAERDVILRTLNATGNVMQAASQLGIHYTTLYRKMKKYDISHH
jgi:transcriptional regulator with PAS, ATPase and Fis domain